MSGVGTVAFQTFLVFAVCAVAIRVALDIMRERERRQLQRGGWILRLIAQGTLRWRER